MTEQSKDTEGMQTGRVGRRIAAVVVPITVATLLLLAIRAGRPAPTKRPVTNQGKPVRVIEVDKQAVIPMAVGYGVVQAAYEWALVAQVSGRVVEMNEQLQVGGEIQKGTKLIKIDPQNYELAEQQRQASLQNVQAQIKQLEEQRQSTMAKLKIEQEALTLAERDLKRNRALFASGSVTQVEVDSAKRSVLSQRGAVQSLENQLRELPSNIAALKAQEQEVKAGLEGATLDVGRTEIFAPFDIRVRELTIQPRELVTSGQTLAVADVIDAAEVPVQLTFGALQPLFAGTATPAEAAPATTSPNAVRRQLRDLGIRALVRVESGGLVAEWRGEVTRITTVNATTRTVGVVVTIGEPVARSPSTPPLLSGMYVEVELSGQKRGGCLAIPRSAVHARDQVYVVDQASRLERRSVTVGMRQAAFVCVQKGLKPGEQVVLTDLQPAVQGMLLAPVIDETSSKSLKRELLGEGLVK